LKRSFKSAWVVSVEIFPEREESEEKVERIYTVIPT
jgi:hypothetical protein